MTDYYLASTLFSLLGFAAGTVFGAVYERYKAKTGSHSGDHT